LVLSRTAGESILIDGNIRVVVVSCKKGGVRLGIECPRDRKILRGELKDREPQTREKK
jgi:carbon storage regulator